MKEKDRKKVIAEVIVDFYEMRANVRPKGAGLEDVENLSMYNLFSMLLSFFYDKHKITEDEVEEVLRERALERLITK